MAGYSGKLLFEKLGLKPGHSVLILNAPATYEAELQPLKRSICLQMGGAVGLDFIHFFTAKKEELKDRFPTLTEQLDQKGCIWISWPKKSSGVKTDLDENVVRAIGLGAGVVDVKVCAVDEIWSGLKFVIRVKDRK
jgi:hypothetical protein